MAAGVRAAASSVISAAQGVASQVRSLLHFSVPDEGPLSDADEYMPDFMELLAKGIQGNSGSVISRVKSLTGQIREQMEGIGELDTGLSFSSLGHLELPDIPALRFREPAFAGMTGSGFAASNTTNNHKTTNLGGVHITVNGYNARDDDELARVVADKINGMISEDDAVFK